MKIVNALLSSAIALSVLAVPMTAEARSRRIHTGPHKIWHDRKVTKAPNMTAPKFRRRAGMLSTGEEVTIIERISDTTEAPKTETQENKIAVPASCSSVKEMGETLEKAGYVPTIIGNNGKDELVLTVTKKNGDGLLSAIVLVNKSADKACLIGGARQTQINPGALLEGLSRTAPGSLKL